MEVQDGGKACLTKASAKQFSDAFIAGKINEMFDLRPAKIIEKFGLKKPNL